MKKNTRARRMPPEMIALMRQQIDGTRDEPHRMHTPSAGWIRTIREALGMTLSQLGRRLGIAPQSVESLEVREREETISLAKLRSAANALECDLHIAFVPRKSLDTIVREQAALKARQERNALVHTMNLESQGAGVESVLDVERATEKWLRERTRQLWD